MYTYHIPLRKQVSTHLVWQQDIAVDKCSNAWILNYLKNHNLTLNIKVPKLYPVNIMRNLARKGAHTELHLIADIESLFVLDIIREGVFIQKFLTTTNQTAVLIRRFEVDNDVDFPQDVNNLFNLYQINKAVEFHKFTYLIGHSIPGLKTWFNYSVESNSSFITEVNYRGNVWEPQLILRKNDPYHFESQSYGCMDQTVLPNTLCRAGFKFYVVSHSFSAHPGIKRKSSVKHNCENLSIINRMFREWLDQKYPKTSGKCK